MLNIIKNTINRVFASGVDSDASAFITATGLSGTTQKSAITTLVKDLKSSGLWSKMKAVYPMVTDNRNLLSYTEDFSNGFWSKSSATITANTTTAPNGTLTADSFNDGAANDYHQVYSQINSLPIGTYTFSFYLKSNTNTKNIAIYPFGTSTPGGTGTGGVILTQNGTFVANASGGVVSYGSQDVGNGWRRFYVVGTSTAISNVYPVISYANGTNVIYTGTNTDAYIWGAQYELGSTPSTYQPILTTPAAFMASQMKYNLKDARDLDAAFRLTWSGGWTYSATGAKDNGINGTANTNFLASSNFTDGNYSFGVYGRTELDGSYTPIGISGTGLFQLYPRFGNTSYYDAIFPARVSAANTSSLGLFYLSRNTTSQMIGYKNGKNVGTSTVTTPSISGTNVLIGRSSAYELAFAYMSNSLSDTDAMLLNQIVEKYQVALSRGVQVAQSFYYNSAYSNEANTYLYSTQITGTTQVSAINTLINGLKANNLWAKMKAVYPFVTDKWNMLAYTEDFSNAAWSKGGGTTVTANSTTAPDGTLTADTIVLPNTGTIAQSLASSSNNTHTLSIYLKASANTTIKLGFLSPGSVVVCNVTTEWQRFTYTYTFSGTTYPQLYNDTGSTVTLFAWGAQAELGSSATTYQPVLGANSYSANVASQMKFNLVNPQDSDAAFRLAFSGGWTYSTNGAQPNGTNGYADTKLIPSANLSTNNTHISSYIRNTSQGVLLGTDNTFRLWIAPNFNGTNRYAEINNGPTTTPTTPISTLIGLWIGSRINASNVKLYNNANTNYSYNILSSGLDTSPIYISARNAAGASNYSSSQVAFSSIGEGLSDADVAILNQLVTDYETSLNRNV